MAISCICHYRPAHKLVTGHLECRAPSRRDPCSSTLLPPSPFSSASHVTFLFLPFRLPPPSRFFNVVVVRFSGTRSVGARARSRLTVSGVLREIPATGSFAWRWNEASIVIVPHQRRFAINLSSCYRRTEPIPLSGTTLGIPLPRTRSINYVHGRSINLPKLDTL